MQFNKFICGLGAAIALCAGGSVNAQTTVIHAGSVIKDAQSEPTGPATIVVTDGKITSIEEGFQPTPEGAAMVHLPDKTVMPGLIDLHTHLTVKPGEDYRNFAVDSDQWYVVLATKYARDTALAGFTTVRDLGSVRNHTMQAIRRGVAEGVIPGPRILTAAMTVSIVGGHGDRTGFSPLVNEITTSGFACTGVVECRESVRRLSRDGADVIKFTATGGVLSQQSRGLGASFTPDEMESIVETAHALGLEVAAHAHDARGIEAATRAGVDTIEHGTYIDEAAAKEMKASGAVLVPTLMAYKGLSENLGTGAYTPAVEAKVRQVVERANVFVANAMKWGVTVAFGTDSGVFAHGRNAEEFALLLAQGMSSRDAVAAATSVAAQVLGMENEIGRLAPGYSADIIALGGNPLEDATLLEQVDWVMVRGRIIE